MKKIFSSLCSVAVAAAFVMLSAGCSRKVESTPELIQIKSGDAQYGEKGGMSSQMVEIEILGPERRSAGGRREVPNVKVRITADNAQPGEEPVEGITDLTGIVRTKVPMGNAFGDRYFTVTCPDFEHVAPAQFRVIAGVSVTGANQETIAGNELPEPVQVMVDGPGGPQSGVPVYFKIISGSKAAVLTNEQALTDSAGIARTQLITDDDYTGAYCISAEVGLKEQTGCYLTRGVNITVLAMDRGNLAIALLGGLAFFIFGMTMMSDGLQLLAGARLKSALQMFTGNRINAILAGLGITALIQSSSATSVMVVGFVNAGLLNLQQGLGVVMGAAIGTTVTSQMVSFNLDVLALPAVIIGVVMLVAARKSTTRGAAETIFGFGVLFYGMMMMSAESKVIAEFPSFQRFFSIFDCTPLEPGAYPPLLPVLGAIGIGILMTVIVQSSSVTVSMTIALASSGLLNFWTAFPLVLGDNIGTTITGILAALNTNRTARQTALASMLFKIFGVIAMLATYYIYWNGVPCFLRLVDIITPGDVFAAIPQAVGRHIANAHTLFSIFAVLVAMPFVGIISWLSVRMVPERGIKENEGQSLCILEPHLLNSPSAAIDQVLTALLAMTREAMSLTSGSINAFIGRTHDTDDKLNHQEAQIDRTQHDIMDYLVKLTRRNLAENQSAIIPAFMHCVNDVERIGDRAINILQLVSSEEASPQKFSETALNETRMIGERLADTGAMLIDGMSRNDQKLIDKVIKYCGEIKMLTARFESNHEARLHSRDCNVENGVIYVELLANLERIAAHLSNLAERARSMLTHRMQFKN